jgi:hypothetical protein
MLIVCWYLHAVSMEDLLVLTSENIRSSKLTITFFFQIEMVVVTVHLSLFLAENKSFIPLLCWKTACSVAWENCIILLIVLIFSPVITWRTPFFSLTLSLLSSLYIAHAWPQQNASTHAASYLALHYIYTWYVQWLGIYMYMAVRRNTLAQTLTQPLFFFIYFIYL